MCGCEEGEEEIGEIQTLGGRRGMTADFDGGDQVFVFSDHVLQ